jgi:Family of unknown function (DUF5302)
MANTPEEQTGPDARAAAPEAAAGAAGTGDDLREKFRAALDRKHGKGGTGSDDHSGNGSPESKASARTSNSKRQREFRRKSGG